MAAVLELQQQLQDHGRQLAQLSQQLQNMESLLKSHEDPLHAFKTPRQSRSPPSTSPTERKDCGAQSCTTEVEIAQARWEALVNMIELEEQTRMREVAELKKSLEICKQERFEERSSTVGGFESKLTDLRFEFEGFVKQIQGRLAMQEDVIKGLTSRPSCKEFNDIKAAPAPATTAIVANEMPAAKLDGEPKMEVPKGSLVNGATVPVSSEGEACRLSQTLAHTQSQDALSDSARRRTNSSSPISRNAYARLGACGKSHTISVGHDVTASLQPKKAPFTAPVAHVAVTPLAPMPCLAREGTTGSLIESKMERSIPEPPRIMTASRLSPPMTYRSVRTPMKNTLTKQDCAFVMPSPPPPRFASPAPFSRPLQESELLLATPMNPMKIRGL